VAQVDGQVDLVVLRDVENVLFVLHVHRHELVADLGRVFSVVHQAELLCLDVLLQLGVVVQPDALALNFLAPAVFVQALAEEDHVGQDNLVVSLVDAVAHAVKIKRENLVDPHILPVLDAQIVVISFPVRDIGVGRQRGDVLLLLVRVLLV